MIAIYPMTASWFSSYNQSQVLSNYTEQINDVQPAAAEQLRQAHQYNEALTAGVRLEANANIAQGEGSSSDDTLNYRDILNAGTYSPMARVKIPSINVDLPIYHGTSDETLLLGAGHLEGSHLPVGGASTHSVITAHRGLADATMFTNLDRVEVGDTFTIETFGEVLSYQVIETKVVEPHQTESLRTVPGEDLVTLITCTPLGINSHRILVTAERITPTPVADLNAAGATPDIPGFPWWVVIAAAGVIAIAVFVWRSGYTDARVRHRKLQRGLESADDPDNAQASTS